MPIYAVDTETYEFNDHTGVYEPKLDCTKFTLGCIIDENLKTTLFHNKQDMWKHIIELGRKNTKRKCMTNIYAHNHEYDAYAYFNLRDRNINWFCTNPFIASYEENGQETIKFLDTHALYRMPLSKIGEMLNLPKLQMPNSITNTTQLTQYITRDCQITMLAIQNLKNKLKNDGINVKRIMTINQLAIQNFLNLMKTKHRPYFFKNAERNWVIFTKNKTMIHSAYHGGRNEAFQTGIHSDVTYIDKNSLYPEMALRIPFPDMRTEKRIHYPLNTINKEDLFQKMGISRALVHNKSNKLGLLPIKTPTISYYPKEGTHFIGTWTNQELQLAEKEGYEVKAIQWSILFEPATENPYHEIVPYLYNKRTQSQTEFDNFFYKSLLNSHFGKLAQYRTGQIYKIDSVEAIKEYAKAGYKAVKGVGQDYLYKADQIRKYDKPYYCPIIPTYVNAYARMEMYKHMKKIPLNDLLYTDTDSIIFTGNHINQFNIGTDIGQFKIVEERAEATIWGRKTYKVGNAIASAGVAKSNYTPEDFEKGYITKKQIIGLKQATNIGLVGTFKTEQHNLRQQMQEYDESIKILRNTELLTDIEVHDESYFYDFLE